MAIKDWRLIVADGGGFVDPPDGGVGRWEIAAAMARQRGSQGLEDTVSRVKLRVQSRLGRESRKANAYSPATPIH
jgi:hypothetical protein